MDRYAKAHLFQACYIFKGEGGLDQEFEMQREREKGSFKQRVNFSECINLVRSLLKVISGETLAASNV